MTVKIMVFDITQGTDQITIEDLPKDLDVVYAGVASELVCYHVDITDYGSLHFSERFGCIQHSQLEILM
jgi:hypothetical protein